MRIPRMVIMVVGLICWILGPPYVAFGESSISPEGRLRDGTQAFRDDCNGQETLDLENLWTENFRAQGEIVALAKGDASRSPVEDIIPGPVKSRFAFGLSVSYHRPTAEAISLVYSEHAIRFDLDGSWTLFPSLAVVAGIGWQKEEGTAVGYYSHQSSGEVSTLKIIPITLGALYEIHRLSTPTLRPFLKGGLAYDLYQETAAGESIRGGKWGLFGRVGTAWRVFGPPPAWTYDAQHGMKETWLEVAAGYELVNSLGRGNNFSGFSLSAGARLTF